MKKPKLSFMRVYISWLIYTDDGSPIKSLIFNTMTNQADFAGRTFHNWNTQILQKEWYERNTKVDKNTYYPNMARFNKDSYSSFKNRK